MVHAHGVPVAAAQNMMDGQSRIALVSDSATGTILIRGKLNGKPGVMILDTGASHSIFDARLYAGGTAEGVDE